MSDFSFHYHLKSNDQQEAVRLLHDASVKGFVFPSTNGWTTFVVEKEINPAVAATNKGILIEMIRSSDYGWGFIIYEGSDIICKYRFEDGATPNFDGFSKDALLKIISADKTEEIDPMLEGWHTTDGVDEPDYGFAEMVGLKHIEWISFNYVERDPEIYIKQYGEIIEV